MQHAFKQHLSAAGEVAENIGSQSAAENGIYYKDSEPEEMSGPPGFQSPPDETAEEKHLCNWQLSPENTT